MSGQPAEPILRPIRVIRVFLVCLAATALLSACQHQVEHLEPAPAGKPIAVPWWDRGVLHVDGAEIATREPDLVFSGGTTLVGHDSADGSRWWLVDGDRLRPLVRSDTLLQPVVAGDGGAVVWVEERGSRTVGEFRRLVHSRVVHYDVDRGRVDASWRTSHVVTCCDAGGALMLSGILTDGRVVMSFLGGAHLVWTPGSDPVRMHGPGVGQAEPEPWPGGTMWQQDAGTYLLLGRLGTIDADGRVRRAGVVPTDQLGQWSPDGAWYVYQGDGRGGAPLKADANHLWVQSPDGERVELHPSRPGHAELDAWESPTAYVLSVYAAGKLVGFERCQVETGACERTSDEPGPRAVTPR